MNVAVRYLLLARDGADGSALAATPKQRLADAFAQNFDDPQALADTLAELGNTRRWVSEVLGPTADLHALRGFARVGARRARNAFR
jgi:hypothetical protein